MTPDPSRRRFLALASASGLLLYLRPAAALGAALPENAAEALARISPFDRGLPDVAPAVFYGDDPARPHRFLRDAAPRPAAQGDPERVPLAVIGGGIAGLTTAYLLRAHRPVVLEQAERFGGNARGQSWRGTDYAIGAAYFLEPEAGSPIDRLLEELRLKPWRTRSGEHPVELHGARHRDFWSGETIADAEGRRQLAKLHRYFTALREGALPYPDIPLPDAATARRVKKLDRLTFRRHLEAIAGGRLHPHLETLFESYCWSSFGAAAGEVSAAAGVNFYAAEFGPLVTLPGGNAAVAERLLERLYAEVPPSNLRPGALVTEVGVDRDGVRIAYQDAAGASRVLLARCAVMACPKFVAARLLQGLEPGRLAAIRRLRYRSYLVANVCLTRDLADPPYDVYLLGEARAGLRPAGATDVVFADYARDARGATVLTLYRPLPYDGGRAELDQPDAYARLRDEFRRQLDEEILPLLGFRSTDVADLRLARWGHPLPVAAPNLIADGVVERLRKPFRDRVFFVHQDNWALPAFETSVTEALRWAPQIGKVLAA